MPCNKNHLIENEKKVTDLLMGYGFNAAKLFKSFVSPFKLNIVVSKEEGKMLDLSMALYKLEKNLQTLLDCEICVVYTTCVLAGFKDSIENNSIEWPFSQASSGENLAAQWDEHFEYDFCFQKSDPDKISEYSYLSSCEDSFFANSQSDDDNEFSEDDASQFCTNEWGQLGNWDN